MTDLQAFKAMMKVGDMVGTRFTNGMIVVREVAKVTSTRVGFYSHRHDDGTISWLDWPKARELSRGRITERDTDVFTIEDDFGTMAYWSEEN